MTGKMCRTWFPTAPWQTINIFTLGIVMKHQHHQPLAKQRIVHCKRLILAFPHIRLVSLFFRRVDDFPVMLHVDNCPAFYVGFIKRLLGTFVIGKFALGISVVDQKREP